MTGLDRPDRREKEIGWLNTHAKRLQLEIPGHWVIVEGDKMVAHGTDYLSVFAEAREKGVKIPFVERIPENSSAVSMGL